MGGQRALYENPTATLERISNLRSLKLNPLAGEDHGASGYFSRSIGGHRLYVVAVA